MWHNKTSRFSVIMMGVALGILLWSLSTTGTAQAYLWQDWWEGEQWWQQEITPPADPNQIINPEYLKKQEELKQTWYQLRRQNNTTNQHARWTHRGLNQTLNDNRARYKASNLESELKKTPMYVEQGAPPAPEPEGEIILKY